MINQPPKKALISEQTVPVLMALVATLFTWWLVQIASFSPLARIIVFGGLCAAMLLKQRWVIYATMAIAVFAASQEWRGDQGSGLFQKDFYFVVVLMGYAIFSLRFTDLKFRFRWRESTGEPRAQQGSDQAISWISTRPFSSGWIWFPLALGMAVLVLWAIPVDYTTDLRLRIKPNGFRAIAVFWFLSLIWFLVSGFFWLIVERNNDPLRARVFARSVVCRQLNRELHGIEKRRARRRDKIEIMNSNR